MANWMGAGTKSYDCLGLVIQRLAGLFIGPGLGARLPEAKGEFRYFPDATKWVSK
jgi:hypothetical protein